MKAYIQTNKEGDFYNVNAFIASVGFQSLGFEVIKYADSLEVYEPDRAAVFVGGISMVRKRLRTLGIEKPDEIEYPEELTSFLHRRVWKSTLKDVIQSGRKGIFIKPVETKLFAGKVITGFKDFIGLGYDREVSIWCSEVVDLVTEWRCFIRYGRLLDVRYYKGAWDSKLDLSVVENAIKAFTTQPAAFCLDFGVDKEGKYYLVEVNDGHSLGTYGIGAISYAKFLSARWSELTATEDMLNF
ncbi:MAG: ATP-grasp domain-containing protein [Bacteroidota bacterium]